ncbi:RAC-beta serine/threonine-protein kinase [Galendromus occidentalis]|uniref:non-specific serine/threonine protein kinase n=1 Tax=Galendromus occidentalis TaxID=34638 RepID=A0AAJ6QMZ2_9ACAR|nr:RAC-beta serine/threonine-protein kinase [Galendromus occidentalis]
MEPKIVKEGWLHKRGEHIPNWRKRYFILRDDGSLIGFKNQPKPGQYSDRLNNFTVKGCQVMCQERPRPYTFILRGLQWTQVIERIFSVDSNEDRVKWVQAIEFVDQNLHQDIEMAEDASMLEHSNQRDRYDALFRKDRQSKITLDKFELIRVLGKGTFGKVVLCRERSTDQLYAIKILKKQVVITKDEVAHTLTESRVLQTTKHPFLISLKYSFQTVDRLCFVMEYVNGGELFFHLSRERIFSEEKTRFYAAEILLALEYLHEQGIIYRDLKLENLLLDREGHIKIADFGLCKEDMTFGGTTRTFCGTAEYLAPEVLDDKDYGRAVDWWGLGVVMFEMMCGRLPFYSGNQEVLFEWIVAREVQFPPTLSTDANTLLRGLLTKDPKLRLGGGKRDAKDIKEHAFFRCMPWERLLARKVTPPFKPQVTSDTDTRYFDQEFTGESVKLTPPENQGADALNSISEESEQPYFQQFSYQGGSSTMENRAHSVSNSCNDLSRNKTKYDIGFTIDRLHSPMDKWRA